MCHDVTQTTINEGDVLKHYTTRLKQSTIAMLEKEADRMVVENPTLKQTNWGPSSLVRMIVESYFSGKDGQTA